MIIGVLGQAKAGKDTLADYLVKKYDFVRIAFADPIKRTLREWYGFTDAQLWGADKEQPDFRYPIPTRGHLTARIAAQTVGTEVGRQVYQDTWVRKALENAKLVLEGKCLYDKDRGIYPRRWYRSFGKKKPLGVVIPDCRFLNEVTGLKGTPGGFIIKVKRREATGAVGILGHQSEEEQKGIPDYMVDHVINNDGTLDELYVEIDRMLRKAPKGERFQTPG